MQHNWTKSTLGHGNLMCRRCFATDLECMALGDIDHCNVLPPAPTNDNGRQWTQEEIDDDLDRDNDGDEDDWLELECGLMRDGQCAMAGTEHCDFTCPNRDSAGSTAWNKKHKRRTRDA